MESAVNENRNVITRLLPNSTSAEIRAHRPRIRNQLNLSHRR